MGTLLSLSKSSTSSALDWSELALLFFGLVVVVGVAGEVAKGNRWKPYLRLFEILVIIGVAGELFADGGIFVFSKHLQTISDLEIAELTKEAGEARKAAGEANERASKNEREAAQLRKDSDELRKDAETEHLTRVKIEAAVAWRQLSERDKRDIAATLSPFGRVLTGASMWFANGSAEAELFADDIAKALRLAHIHTTTVGGVIDMREGGGNWDKPIESANTGVDIQSTSNPVSRKLADALLKELTSRGFDAKRQADQPPQDQKPSAPVIWVTVQARPREPQGEYKLAAEREAKNKSNPKTK